MSMGVENLLRESIELRRGLKLPVKIVKRKSLDEFSKWLDRETLLENQDKAKRGPVLTWDTDRSGDFVVEPSCSSKFHGFISHG